MPQPPPLPGPPNCTPCAPQAPAPPISTSPRDELALGPLPCSGDPAVPRGGDKEAAEESARRCQGVGARAGGRVPRCPGCRRCRAAAPRDSALRLAANACVQRDLFLLGAGRVVYLVVPFPGKVCVGVSLPGMGVCSRLLCPLRPHGGHWGSNRVQPPPPSTAAPVPPCPRTPSQPAAGLQHPHAVEDVGSRCVPASPWGTPCLSFPSRRCDAAGHTHTHPQRYRGSPCLGGVLHPPEPHFHPRRVGGQEPRCGVGGQGRVLGVFWGVLLPCRWLRSRGCPRPRPRGSLAGTGGSALPGRASPLPSPRKGKKTSGKQGKAAPGGAGGRPTAAGGAPQLPGTAGWGRPGSGGGLRAREGQGLGVPRSVEVQDLGVNVPPEGVRGPGDAGRVQRPPEGLGCCRDPKRVEGSRIWGYRDTGRVQGCRDPRRVQGCRIWGCRDPKRVQGPQEGAGVQNLGVQGPQEVAGTPGGCRDPEIRRMPGYGGADRVQGPRGRGDPSVFTVQGGRGSSPGTGSSQGGWGGTPVAPQLQGEAAAALSPPRPPPLLAAAP